VTDVDALFISHAHPDHFVDIYPFFYSMFWRPDRKQQVPVYGPKMAHERMSRLLTPRDGQDDFNALLPWSDFKAGQTIEVGPLRLTAFESAHSCTNVCLRIEADGKTLTYTGDTGPHPALEKAAADADLFLCEASWLESERSIPEPIHLRSREAGEIASRAGAKHLVLTHVWPHNDMDLVLAQAAAAYEGPLEIADGNMRWSL
jgi:ribonuclease BN (tRNA processing enzyme)